MKAELISEQEMLNPKYRKKDASAAKQRGERYTETLFVKAPAGTVIKDPKAYMLVRMGIAIPADDECRERAGMTEEKMKAAIHAQRRTAAGIHPDDFAAYDCGEMVGYNGDGSYKPGPNAPKPSEEEAALNWLIGEDEEDSNE